MAKLLHWIVFENGSPVDKMGRASFTITGTPTYYGGGPVGSYIRVQNSSCPYFNPVIQLPRKYSVSMKFKYPLVGNDASYYTLLRGVNAGHPALIRKSDMKLGVWTTTFADSGFDVTTLGSGWHTFNMLVNNDGNGSYTGSTFFYIDNNFVGSTNVTAYDHAGNRGFLANGTGTSQSWGEVCDFRIYDGLLSARERRDLHRNLIFRFLPAGSSLGDSSGFSSAPTIVGSPKYGTTKTKAVILDGTSYLTFNNNQYLQNVGNQTLLMVLTPGSAFGTARRNPWGKAYGGEGTITQEMNGTFNYYWGIGGANGGSYQGVGMSMTVAEGETATIAVVRNLDVGSLYFYKNGVATTSVKATYGSAVASTLPRYIGNGYTNPYIGSIGLTEEYAYAFTPSEVLEWHREAGAMAHDYTLHSKQLIEPASITIKSGIQTMSVADNIYNSTGNWTITNGNVSAFAESDNSLGSFAIVCDVILSGSEYYPTVFEWCKINNGSGVNGTFKTINGSWLVGSNVCFFEPRSYSNLGVIDWSTMTRLEVYRSGPAGSTDTTQTIGIGNMRVIKFPENYNLRGLKVYSDGIRSTEFNEYPYMRNANILKSLHSPRAGQFYFDKNTYAYSWISRDVTLAELGSNTLYSRSPNGSSLHQYYNNAAHAEGYGYTRYLFHYEYGTDVLRSGSEFDFSDFYDANANIVCDVYVADATALTSVNLTFRNMASAITMGSTLTGVQTGWNHWEFQVRSVSSASRANWGSVAYVDYVVTGDGTGSTDVYWSNLHFEVPKSISGSFYYGGSELQEVV